MVVNAVLRIERALYDAIASLRAWRDDLANPIGNRRDRALIRARETFAAKAGESPGARRRAPRAQCRLLGRSTNPPGRPNSSSSSNGQPRKRRSTPCAFEWRGSGAGVRSLRRRGSRRARPRGGGGGVRRACLRRSSRAAAARDGTSDPKRIALDAPAESIVKERKAAKPSPAVLAHPATVNFTPRDSGGCRVDYGKIAPPSK
jgi:hypothetical protein